MELKSVLTIQEPVEVPKEELKPIKLEALLEAKGVFAQLETTAQAIFNMFAVLVNGQAVEALDAYVDQEAQVVVLPRIRGG